MQKFKNLHNGKINWIVFKGRRIVGRFDTEKEAIKFMKSEGKGTNQSVTANDTVPVKKKKTVRKKKK